MRTEDELKLLTAGKCVVAGLADFGENKVEDVLSRADDPAPMSAFGRRADMDRWKADVQRVTSAGFQAETRPTPGTGSAGLKNGLGSLP